MHPLSQQIRLVGRKARRLLLWRGFALWMCALLVAAIVVAGADYWFRFGERPMRWLATMVVVALGIWSWTWLVWPAWSLWCSEETIAGWVERRFPDLRDRLTSAVSFLRQDPDDGRFGSPSLRQDLVEHVAGEVAGRNLSDCLDSRAAWRAGMALLVIVLSVFALCATDLQSATIAARRLAMPWRDEMWPRRNWLVFVQHPEKLAKGQDFLVELIDKRGWLPQAVEIQYWFEGDRQDEIRRHPMVYAGGKMTHRLPRVDRSFRYRAVGGDDDQMEWNDLKVIDPPQLVEVNIRLRPPAYTGLPEQLSGRHIRGIEGTSLEVTGRVNKPIAMAAFEFAAGANMETVPARVSSDGLEFRLPLDPEHDWLLGSPGDYSWALVDREGFALPSSGKSAVDVMVDKPPTISLEWPSPDASFTAQAEIPLRLVVKDDLALQRVVWETEFQTHVIEMRTFPPQVDATDSWPPHGEQRSIEHLIDLRAFGDLQAGDTLHLRIVATDFKPQESEALELSLSILSLDEWKARIEQRHMAVRQRLLETLRLQRTVRMQTSAYRDESVQVDPSSSQGARLPGIQLGQSRVRAQLDGSQGAMAMVASLLEELQINRIVDLQLSRQLSRTNDDLQRIVGELLPVVEQNLQRADRLERDASSSRQKVGGPMAATSADALKNTLDGQDQVILALEELVDRLGEWSAYRMLAQDVAQLQDEQEALQNETAELPTASKDLLQLSAAEQQLLSQLSERQSELALRVERIDQRLERMRRQLGEGNPLAASAMDEALKVIRDLAITADMRQAAQQLAQNRIGSAGTDQARAVQSLQRLEESLLQRSAQDAAASNQRQSELDNQLLGQQLSGLRDRQEAINRLTTELSGKSSDGRFPASVLEAAIPLSGQQNDLAKVANSLAEQVKSRAAFEFALQHSSKLMEQAARRLVESGPDAEVTRVQSRASVLIGALLDAIRQDAPQPPDNSSQAKNASVPPTENEKPSASESRVQTVELKLLRAWQADINLRTESILADKPPTQPLPASDQRELSELATEQIRVAEMVERLFAK